MKIALLGYGKMGKAIEKIALQKEYEVIAKITSQSPLPMSPLQQADVWLDFSHPHAILDHVRAAAETGKPLVVGTTGWDEKIQDVQETINKSSIGLIYSANFSLGVHIFLQLVSQLAQLIDPLQEFDIAGTESHHAQKADVPSGTAITIGNTILKQLKRKTTITTNDNPQPHELHFTSLRCGTIPGTHTIIANSPTDSITLTHQSHSRDAFAQGALNAAKWIIGKKGFYTLEEMMRDSYNAI